MGFIVPERNARCDIDLLRTDTQKRKGETVHPPLLLGIIKSYNYHSKEKCNRSEMLGFFYHYNIELKTIFLTISHWTKALE